jgi:hypothetical protein
MTYLYLVSVAEKSCGWTLVLAATLYATAKNQNEAAICVHAVRRILTDIKGPIRPTRTFGCWELWRGFNAVHDVLREEASLELTIHIERYYEAYRKMWNADWPHRKAREVRNFQLERGFCERAFEKDFPRWSAKMASWELKMRLGLSPWAIVPAQRGPPGVLWKRVGYGWYQRQQKPDYSV